MIGRAKAWWVTAPCNVDHGVMGYRCEIGSHPPLRFLSPYEWYQGYKDLRRLLNPIHFATQKNRDASVKPQIKTMIPSNEALRSFPSREQCRVLILGCGNSTFGQDMLMDGWWGGIVNVDFSQIVIDQMRQKYNDDFYQRIPQRHRRQPNQAASPPRMEFVCADMTKRLPFDDKSFDLIVCKGSFDAVLCGAGSVGSIKHVVRECVRLLTPGHGILFLVTHANPDNRIVFLEHKNDINHYWEGVSVHCMERPVESIEDPRWYVGTSCCFCTAVFCSPRLFLLK